MFYAADILVKEHDQILCFAALMKKECCLILQEGKVDTALFRRAVSFVRNYADRHHHGKEEQILFERMLLRLGTVAEKLIKAGMLVEHDLGRLYMSELEKALERYDAGQSTEDKLDILTYMTAYIDLIKRHAEKENAVVFGFAERSLAKEDKDFADGQTRLFEEDAEKAKERDAQLLWLEELKEKWNK